METRTLGQGLNRLGRRHGLQGTTHGYGPAADQGQMVRIIRSAVDRGVTR